MVLMDSFGGAYAIRPYRRNLWTFYFRGNHKFGEIYWLFDVAMFLLV
jgi:hypothetical protein